MTRATAALAALLVLASSPAALAQGDYWVDAVLGDDAGGDGSAQNPWRTITWALGAAPAPRTVHIAPGTYDAALGETYGLSLAQETHLVGTGGSEVTILDAGGVGLIFSLRGDTTTSFTGLTLRGTGTALYSFLPEDQSHWTSLRDVVITDVDRGLYADVFGFYVGATYRVELEDVLVDAREIGVHLVGGASTNGCDLEVAATEVTIRSAAEYGVLLHAGEFAEIDFVAERCRVEGCGTGVEGRAYGYGSSSIAVLNHSLLAGNGVGARGGFRLGHSTVADNGVGAIFGPGCTARGTIFAANGDDVVLLPQSAVEFCDVEDGDRAGVDGNFSADPLFLDPANGDWRLTFGSPCVDAANPNAPAGELDLAGIPRPVDGDLDAAERNDVGALELAPLEAPGQASIGTTATLELWGPPGGTARVLWARGFPHGPTTTPFGELELERGRLAPLGVGPTAPGPPATFPLPIPADPVWIGTHLSLQALTTSPNHPLGAALTNAVVLEITS